MASRLRKKETNAPRADSLSTFHCFPLFPPNLTQTMLKSPLFVFFACFLTVCLLLQMTTTVVKYLGTHSYPAFIQVQHNLKTLWLTNLRHLG